MGKILVNLCLTDIPREYIKEITHKDGKVKKYINIVVAEMKDADKQGNDYTVYAYKSKEHRDDETTWLGRGKTMMPKEVDAGQSAGQSAPTQSAPKDENDDLPF